MSLSKTTKAFNDQSRQSYCSGLQAGNLIKKRLYHRFFFANIAKLSKAPILRNICKRLLLQQRLVLALRVWFWFNFRQLLKIIVEIIIVIEYIKIIIVWLLERDSRLFHRVFHWAFMVNYFWIQSKIFSIIWNYLLNPNLYQRKLIFLSLFLVEKDLSCLVILLEPKSLIRLPSQIFFLAVLSNDLLWYRDLVLKINFCSSWVIAFTGLSTTSRF